MLGLETQQDLLFVQIVYYRNNWDTVKLHERTVVANQLLPVSRWPHLCTTALFEFFLSCLSNQLSRWLNLKVLFSMFPTLDFLGSVLHKNWLEKDLLLNKESDFPTATICIINRKPFLSFSVRSSVLQQSHPSSFVVQVTHFLSRVHSHYKKHHFLFWWRRQYFRTNSRKDYRYARLSCTRLHRPIKW